MTIVDFDSGQVAEKIRRAAGNTVAGHALRQADASSLRDRYRAVIRVAHALTEMVGPSDPARAARLRHGLTAARSLHQHFYEGDLPPDLVRSLVAEVMDAVDLLDSAFGDAG